MRLTLQNFRCFRQKRIFDFNVPNDDVDGLVGKIILIRGVSGAGKSTLFEAIRWCLFGGLRNITPSGGAVDGGKTIVTLEYFNPQVKITRTYPSEQLKIELPDSIELAQESAQSYIASTFGTKNVWHSTSIIRQNEKCLLLTGSNQERFGLLNEILFGSENFTDFDNPDFYLEKIESQIETLETEITGKTAIFNSNYSRYVEDLKNYKNDYGWKTMTDEMIEAIKSAKIGVENEISALTPKLVESAKLSTRRKLLTEKLASLSEKVKGIESMNLDTENYLLNSYKKEMEPLGKEIEENQAEIQKSVVASAEHSILDENLKSLENRLKQIPIPIKTSAELSSELKLLTEKLNKIVSIETLRIGLETQSQKLDNDKKLYQEQIDSVYSSLGFSSDKTVKELLEILDNTQNYYELQKIKQQMDSLGEVKAPLVSNKTELTTKLYSSKIIEEKCAKFSVDFTGLQTLMKEAKEKLEFHDKQNPHLEKYKIYCNIQNEENTLKTLIKPNPQDSRDILTMKIRDIESRLGTPLKCPCCNVVLEMKNNQLVKPESEIISKEDGLSQIAKLKEDLATLIHNEQIETKISSLKVRINEISQELDMSLVSAEKLSDEAVKRYRSVITECFNLSTEEYKPSSQILEEIKQIDTYESYQKLYTEYTTKISKFKNDIPVVNETVVNTLSKACMNLPILTDKFTFSVNQYGEVVAKLASLECPLESSVKVQSEIGTLKTDLDNALNYENTQKHIQIFESKIAGVLPRIKNIKPFEEKIEEINVKVIFLQNLVLEKNDLIKYIVEYNSVKNDRDSIVISDSEESLNNTLTFKQEQLKDIEVQLLQATFMRSLLASQKDLTDSQQNLLNLTTRKTNLNNLKNIVLDVTNSALQDLVDNINDLTNAILEELFETSIVIELKLYKEAKTGKNKGVKRSVNFGIHYNGNVYDSPANLSGGEMARLSLAMTVALAMIHDTKVLCLDESSASLDETNRETCLETIKKFLLTQDRIILMSEHVSIEGMYSAVIDV